ncbi:hypothetical protein GCM10028805_64280 [Spirosoma harenae]
MAFYLSVIYTNSSAQIIPYSTSQKQRIAQLQTLNQKNHDATYSKALTLAAKLGRPIREIRSNGQIVELAGIDDLGNLIYLATNVVGNTQAGISTRTTSLYAGGSLGLNLSGSSASVQNKLGLWDGGAVRATHIELAGRVTQNDKASTTVADEQHPSHVATTMIGAGVNPLVRGMSFGAKLQAWDFSNDLSEMTAAAPNLLISNHSYGPQSGYQYNSSRTGSTQWEWYGDTTISQTYDYKFGQYNSQARSWDQIAIAAPYYLVVKSAGNDHGGDGYPGGGQAYVIVNNDNKISTVTRDRQTGYDQIATYGVAKNILTVGAVNDLSYGYNLPEEVSIASFSSWGPADDGRIKPDIVGIGVNLLSANSSSDSAYVTLSGTSMATPNVSGSLLLLQEYYTQLKAGSYMRSSTLRGLVLHTASEAGSSPGPDYKFGWGILNMEQAARVIGNTDQNHLLTERTLNQGQRDTIQVTASGRGQLVATICWTDPVGTPTNAVNDRTPKLVNDLDIRLSDGKDTFRPWVLDPNNPANAATQGDNVRDNVEQVLLTNTIPGKVYTLIISHKATLNGSKQDYALIVSGIGGTTYCESKPTSTADTKISHVQFGTINQAGADGCTSYTDFSQISTTVQANQQLPLIISLGTCGTNKNTALKAFADWNQNGRFDDAGETIATSGILSNSGQFSTTVTIPASVQNGQLIRLRILASETDDPSAISPCGLYSQGETQDYTLKVIQTINDVGVTALVSPDANFCGQTTSDLAVTVRLHNYGSADQTNVPISVKITDANNVDVITLTSTLLKLPAFRDGLLTLTKPEPTSLVAGQTYRFMVVTGLISDQNIANNTMTATRTTGVSPGSGLFQATRCGSDTAVALRNTGAGVASWYDALTGGNLLAVGNQTYALKVPTSGQFYASLNDFSGIVGPADKNAFGGGTYFGAYAPAPLFSTTVPLLIESARLYIGNPGQITFTVSKYDNTIVSSVTLDVTPTRDQSLTATTSNGNLLDDPNDKGAIYPLNLRIPAAGDYKISISYSGGATIFRSNSAVSGYPYQLKTQNGQPVVTIKGSLSAPDTLTNAWYYFYNIKVRSLECPNLQRSPVNISTGTYPTVTTTPTGSVSICQGSSNTFMANTEAGLTYQWYRNGQVITGATSSSLQAAITGNYSVAVAGNCLPIRSSVISLSVNSPQIPVITANGIALTTNAISAIQWLLDGVAITGATSSSYTAIKSGRYSVNGSVNGCGAATSTEVVITILATEPIVNDDEFSVYPNPATKQLTVSFTAASSLLQPPNLRLIDLQGRTIKMVTLQKEGKSYSTVVDVANLSDGMFFVVIEDEQTQRVRIKRIQKQ